MVEDVLSDLISLLRLISNEDTNWKVKWWCGNKSEIGCAPPTKIPIDDLHDELWADASGRRQIREDLVLEFCGFPYTDEISVALQPHLAVLEKLNTEDESNYPAVSAVEGRDSRRNSGHARICDNGPPRGDIKHRLDESEKAVRFIDVDHKCLGFIEERLFENSLQEGLPGINSGL
ncbi:hypothetical protein B0H19DRAFT_1083019 [Mycena capillaripes]|nr:hypothetical protein B0H19DRAFT_1083019 [Mycena capillaripes]